MKSNAEKDETAFHKRGSYFFDGSSKLVTNFKFLKHLCRSLQLEMFDLFWQWMNFTVWMVKVVEMNKACKIK